MPLSNWKQHRDDVSVIQPIRKIQIGKKKKGVLKNKNVVTGVKATLQKRKCSKSA